MTKIFKQVIPFIVCCFLTMSVFAQNTNPVKKTSPVGALTPDRSKMLCQAWQLDTISEFAVDNKVTSKEANDGVTFVSDGSFFITQEGAASTGTWKYSAGRINTVTSNPDNKMSLRIISLADDHLVLEYQDPDLNRTQYTYHPKKQQ
jgi:hypothetical protein